MKNEQPQHPKIAIVILSWNGKKFLEQFLPSVLATQYSNFEVFVADNASTDGSVTFLQQHFPKVNIIAIPFNKGFAEGYNYALRQVQADYYVLLNQDVEVRPDWLQPLVNLMEGNEKIAACQPKIKAYHQKTHFEYAGAAGGWIDKFGYTFSRGRMFDHIEEDLGQYDEEAEIFWASGACLMIRPGLFYKYGAFDPDFFAHMEEIDLCWRLKNAGYSIKYCPQSIVYHVGGGSLPQGNPKKVYLNFRNSLKMMFKNLPLYQMIWKVPVRIGLDIIAANKYLIEGKPLLFFAIARAHFDFFRRFPRWMKKRVAARELVLNPNIEGVYNGSVIWKYFIKKKHTFKEIKSID